MKETLSTVNLHLQALSRILSEEEGEEDKDKRPAGSDVPRDEIDQVKFPPARPYCLAQSKAS
jgi:hypothetical protein